jgi:group I intron endonuclease
MKGIYQIKQISTGRIYIGSTKRFEHRKYIHLRDLSKGAHHCSYLQRVWNNAKGEGFEFTLIETVEDVLMLIVREQAHIDAVRPTGLLMNTCKVAGSCLGVKQTEETKKRRAESLRGSKRTIEQRKNISLARKAVGITRQHQAALNDLSRARAFNLSKTLAEKIMTRRLNGETFKEIAGDLGVSPKPLRREIRKAFPDQKWSRVKGKSGGGRPGADHKMAKLTEAQAIEIRRSTESTKSLANILGVSYSCVHDVRTRRSWSHLNP